MNPNLLTLSHSTYVGPSGATAAATYEFFTKDYKQPMEERHVQYDIVHNQNGKFKYVYDNGPGFRRWPPFSIKCEERFSDLGLGNAATQYTKLKEMWEFKGVLGMKAPEGSYLVHWSDSGLEHNFRVFPREVGDVIEREVIVQFEEGQ